MYNIFKKKKNNQGMALAMSLLISSLIMVSVLLLTSIIVNEVKMSLNSGNSIYSFYVAESGIEQGLYSIKYGARTHDFSRFENLHNTEHHLSYGSYKFLTTTLSNLGFSAYNISTSSSVHVDIIDPAGDIGASDINWHSSVNAQGNIEWSIDNCFYGNHGNDRLEVTLFSFAGNFNSPFTKTENLYTCNCNSHSDNCNGVIISSLANTKYYRFKFRAFDEEIEELGFKITQGNDEIGILSQAKISVQGEYHNSKYRLEAVIPSLAPVSDIFSYVIFSEQDITKSDIITPPPIQGCPDEEANNYVPGANGCQGIDGNTGCCEYNVAEVHGCTDPNASNYVSGSSGCESGNNSCCTYNIDESSDFDYMNNSYGTHTLINNINLTETFDPVDNFHGIFNGGGFWIKNINISETGNNVGLFSDIYDAEINNVQLLIQTISGGDNTGGLVGYMENSEVNNIRVSGSIISGGDNTGGLVGYMKKSTINESYVNIYSISGNIRVGGLVGYNIESPISPYSKISNSYAKTNITANDYIGGIIGKNNYAQIEDSYSASTIYDFENITNAGGISGYGSPSSHSFYDCEVIAESACNYPTSSEDKSTAEMKDFDTFHNPASGWEWSISTIQGDQCLSTGMPSHDCIWYIDNGNDYPHLQWEYE